MHQLLQMNVIFPNADVSEKNDCRHETDTQTVRMRIIGSWKTSLGEEGCQNSEPQLLRNFLRNWCCRKSWTLLIVENSQSPTFDYVWNFQFNTRNNVVWLSLRRLAVCRPTWAEIQQGLDQIMNFCDLASFLETYTKVFWKPNEILIEQNWFV